MAVCMWCKYEIVYRQDKTKMQVEIVKHLLECKDHPLTKRIDVLMAQLESIKSRSIIKRQILLLQAANKRLREALGVAETFLRVHKGTVRILKQIQALKEP